MSDYVVLDHHHDDQLGVYRVVIGIPVIQQIPMTDEEGGILRDDDDQPMLEERELGHAGIEDFVFADDDERWHGKDADTVASEQRELVKKALSTRQHEAEEAAAARSAALSSMPGSGEAL